MKKYIALVLVLGVILGGIALKGSRVEYVNTETVVEKEVPTLEKRIETAITASSTEIEAEAQKAYEAAKKNAENEIALRITTEYKKEIEQKETDLEKEVGAYWRDKGNIVALIREWFPEEPHRAVAIATCESGLNPNAKNVHNTDGTTDGGLFQINDVHNKRLDELGLDKYNPEDAVRFARLLYEKNGWKDWVCARKV